MTTACETQCLFRLGHSNRSCMYSSLHRPPWQESAQWRKKIWICLNWSVLIFSVDFYSFYLPRTFKKKFLPTSTCHCKAGSEAWKQLLSNGNLYLVGEKESLKILDHSSLCCIDKREGSFEAPCVRTSMLFQNPELLKCSSEGESLLIYKSTD